MKKGFKQFLLVCFMFTFVFSLAFAGPGDPPICPNVCCDIVATPQCSAGKGVQTESEGFCICVPVQELNFKCEIITPICQ